MFIGSAPPQTLLKQKVQILTGLDILINKYKEQIKGLSIALVTNQTGIDKQGIPNYERLMDIESIHLKKIFSPEHGLFGEEAAGETLRYDNTKTELPEIISLYDAGKKPTDEMFNNIDLILYDIQDIGSRFYTYISTLGLVMEKAGELGIPVWILDRPNPISGTKIEGPILDITHKSFVGYYPIPIRYGLTVGELGRMILTEKWIDPIPKLEIISMEGWARNLWYDETNLKWIKPSPNIPDLETAILYPGICLLEGTNISEGRGTENPFKWIGAPWIHGKILAVELNKIGLPGVSFTSVEFTPIELPGIAINPKYQGESCSGVKIKITNRNTYKSVQVGITILSVLQLLYPEKIEYKPFLNNLWGRDDLAAQLKTKLTLDQLIDSIEEEISLLDYSKYYLY
jgi:uncharacterized protein YbbC (DUF1343 family)